MTIEIYTLSHPVTNEVRYIGKANDSKKRLSSHLRDSKRRNTPVYCWMRKLTSDGLIPLINVIKVTDSENWKSAEIRLISEYKSKGFNLLNVAIGGDEPYCSYEVRANNGRETAKAIHSDELRKKFWKLKLELGMYFKKANNSEHAIGLKKKLALHGIYFKN